MQFPVKKNALAVLALSHARRVRHAVGAVPAGYNSTADTIRKFLPYPLL